MTRVKVAELTSGVGAVMLGVGDARDGELKSGDPTTSDGRFVDTWTVDAPERGALELSLSTQGDVVPLAGPHDHHALSAHREPPCSTRSRRGREGGRRAGRRRRRAR